MGKTFAEKILSLKSGRDVSAGDIVIVTPDYCLSHENAASVSQTFSKLAQRVWDPSRIVITLDHTVPAPAESYANVHAEIRRFVKEQGIAHFYDLNCHGGICHQIMCQEAYAMPGRLIIGTDSHTCTAGAVGAFATGIGRSEMASIWACGEIWLKVPQTIRVVLRGHLRPGVYAKDLALYLVGRLRAGGASYQCLQFEGEGAAALSVAERMTVCNMGVEMDAKAAVFRPDDTVRKFLQGKQTDEAQYIWSRSKLALHSPAAWITIARSGNWNMFRLIRHLLAHVQMVAWKTSALLQKFCVENGLRYGQSSCRLPVRCWRMRQRRD